MHDPNTICYTWDFRVCENVELSAFSKKKIHAACILDTRRAYRSTPGAPDARFAYYLQHFCGFRPGSDPFFRRLWTNSPNGKSIPRISPEISIHRRPETQLLPGRNSPLNQNPSLDALGNNKKLIFCTKISPKSFCSPSNNEMLGIV